MESGVNLPEWFYSWKPLGGVLAPPEVISVAPGGPLEHLSTEVEMVGGEVLWVLDSYHLKYAAVRPQDIFALKTKQFTLLDMKLHLPVVDTQPQLKCPKRSTNPKEFIK